jgi:hypothetical protein
MEFTKAEIAVVEDAAVEATESNMHELNDLQLMLVGGGCGETVYH